MYVVYWRYIIYYTNLIIHNGVAPLSLSLSLSLKTQNLKGKRQNQIKAHLPRDTFRDVEVNEETGNMNYAVQAYLQCWRSKLNENCRQIGIFRFPTPTVMTVAQGR